MNEQSLKQDILSKGQRQPIEASVAWCEMRIAKIINGDEIKVKKTKELIMIKSRQDEFSKPNDKEFVCGIIKHKIANLYYLYDYIACDTKDVNVSYVSDNGNKGTIISFKIDPILEHNIASKPYN